MKNILIIIAIVAIAFFAYNYFNKPEYSQASSEAVSDNKSDSTSTLISSAPENAAVFILEPGGSATVTSPLTIKFGIANMQVVAAGQDIANSGHHHLLVDLEELPDMTQPLPANDNVIHFGKGQTETTIELTPGKHSLQLLLGNYLHIPHQQAVISKKINITVE